MTTTILIIDDNKAHRSLIRRAIKKSGRLCSVIEADSLNAARQILFCSTAGQSRPDIILLDLNLSDGRGTTLLKELRQNTALSKLPVVVISTSPLEADRAESFSCGATTYLTKAENLEEFTAQIVNELKIHAKA